MLSIQGACCDFCLNFHKMEIMSVVFLFTQHGGSFISRISSCAMLQTKRLIGTFAGFLSYCSWWQRSKKRSGDHESCYNSSCRHEFKAMNWAFWTSALEIHPIVEMLYCGMLTDWLIYKMSNLNRTINM